MRRNRLGRSRIVVSDIGMGSMISFTTADEKTALEIVDRSFAAGISPVTLPTSLSTRKARIDALSRQYLYPMG